MDADRQCLVFYTQFINLITIQHIISGLRLSLASWVWSLVDTVLLYYYNLSLAGGLLVYGPSSTQSSCNIIVYRWLGGFLSVVPRRHNPPVLLSLIVGLGGFLSVVPRRHSPPVLLSFIVGLVGFPSALPRRHSPPVLL